MVYFEESGLLEGIVLFIVGFVGFYGVYLVDGLEYRGYYGLIDEVFWDFYFFCIEWLLVVVFDLLVFEILFSF